MIDETLIGPLGYRLTNLFTRRPTPFGARTSWQMADAMLRSMLEGGISLRICRVPAEHLAEAMLQCPEDHSRESAEHRQMKRACLLWMRALGSKNAAEEVRYCGFKADVLSDDLNWIVECGHTGLNKPQDLMMADPASRFTLVPYQDMRRHDGRPRSLIAVDVAWTPEAATRTTAIWDEKMRRAVSTLRFRPIARQVSDVTPPRSLTHTQGA